MARVVPAFAAVLHLVTLSTIGLPGTNGFVGEFLVLLGTTAPPGAGRHRHDGVIFAAAYLLWALQRSSSTARNAREQNLPDLSPRELAVLIPLVVGICGWASSAPVLEPDGAGGERLTSSRRLRTQCAVAARPRSPGGALSHDSTSRPRRQLTLASLPELVLLAGAMVAARSVPRWRPRARPAAPRPGDVGLASCSSRRGRSSPSWLIAWAWRPAATAGHGRRGRLPLVRGRLILLGDGARHRFCWMTSCARGISSAEC